MVIESKDLEVVERTQKVMQEVNEAEQRSCSKLRMVPEVAGILQSGFEADWWRRQRGRCRNQRV